MPSRQNNKNYLRPGSFGHTMLKIEYPAYHPRIKKENNTEFIFDEIRKKWVVFTPEEWVRQNFLQYLVQVQKISPSLIAVEKELSIHDVKKRFDIVVYNKETQPFILIECKETGVALTESVLQQVLRYHSVIRAPYIIITNGTYTCAFSTGPGELTTLSDFPQ
jgi:hypothetical protein